MMKRIGGVSFVFAAVLLWGQFVVSQEPVEQPASVDQPKQRAQASGLEKPRVYVTISKETTYLTEPLRKDGYVDYVGALNRRGQEGVTPENNAAIPFLKAIGPAEILAKYRDEYFRMLGIEPLPEKGDYFLTCAQYAKGLEGTEKPVGETSKEWVDILEGQSSEAMKRPWTRKEFPALAGWIAVNEKPLALILEASKRPRRYDPLLPADGSVMGILLPAVNQYRITVRALTARAMLRLGDGKVDEAWKDLLAGHRLARLAAQGPTLVDFLIGIVIDNATSAGDQALLQHARLTASQIVKMRDDLVKLPPMACVGDKFDMAERFLYLDCVVMVARNGFGVLDVFSGRAESKKSEVKSLIHSMIRVATDWDQVLRVGNSWCDRMVIACRNPVRAERRKAWRMIHDDLYQLKAPGETLGSVGLLALCGNREAVTQKIGEVHVSEILIADPAVVDAEDRWTMQCQLTELAFALAAYRADQGAYPAKLTQLCPKYVAEVPDDIFTAADLHYKQEGDGYLLYSLGPNGKDDGGKGWDDRQEGEDRDDIAVRISAK